MKTPQPRRAAAILVSVVIFASLAPQAIASAKTHPNRWKDTTPPSASISAPTSGATVTGAISVTGTASDNASLAAVQVSVDGGAFQAATGTTSWNYGLDTTALSNASHTITAKATDGAGNTSSTSETVTVSNPVPDTTNPTVAISAPAAGATVSGSVSVTGSASDNMGLAKIEVSVDGGAFQMATGTASWSYGLDTTTLSNASHTITAKATDGSGNTSSTSESVTVSNAVPDTTNPTVAISSPTSGATVSGTISVTGSASDNASVAEVEVSVDSGTFQLATGTTSWSYSLNTTTLSNASHTITARATDGSGNSATASVSVTVSNSTGSSMVTPEGVTITVAPDVTGWTPQQLYDILKPNAYQLDLIGPDLTIRIQTQYPSSTSTSASSSGGVYTSFRATIYLNAASGQVFNTRPDYVTTHEYGHAWTMYHYYLTQQKNWNPYLTERGILNDPRLNTSYSWSTTEMIADDYRMLFGTQTAQNQAGYINPDIPDPRTVPGLKTWFMTVWAGGT